MTVNELASAIDLKIVQPTGGDNEVTCGYTSDLLSDVMANAGDGCVLITIQAHVNTVAVASLIGAAAIIICNDHTIPDDMIQSAKRESIAVLQTDRNQFTASHLVYARLSDKK